MSQKLTVCVLFGGQSSEHEISRISATSIIKNLNKEKYDIVIIGITKAGKWLMYRGPVDKIATGEWENNHVAPVMIAPDASINGLIILNEEIATKAKIDVVFPVLHGLFGEDGTIQGLLELAHIPYVGPGVLSSALCMDKAYAKVLFQQTRIPQADWLIVMSNELEDMAHAVKKIEDRFSYPLFIKPCNAGSSMGITKAHSRSEAEEGLKLAAEQDEKILIEEFIPGREIECAVLGNECPNVSALGEIVPGREFYDYQAKYKDEGSTLIIPASLPEDTVSKIKEYTIQAFKALGCKGLARVDFFVHKESGEIYINEINTMPGFTSISMYPKLWEEAGVSYAELLDALINLALEGNR